MAYVAVDSNENEIISNNPLKRKMNKVGIGGEWEFVDFRRMGYPFEIPKGSIEKLIGKKLTWEDEPVELKGKDDE